MGYQEGKRQDHVYCNIIYEEHLYVKSGIMDTITNITRDRFRKWCFEPWDTRQCSHNNNDDVNISQVCTFITLDVTYGAER